MVHEKFVELIRHLASCNGTGDSELEKRVSIGEVTEHEAGLIRFYVSIEKLKAKLDHVSSKLGVL